MKLRIKNLPILTGRSRGNSMPFTGLAYASPAPVIEFPSTLALCNERNRMETIPYSNLPFIRLGGNPNFSNEWLLKKIQDNPSILGLPSLAENKENLTSSSQGINSIILEDKEFGQRYLVSVQIGELTSDSYIEFLKNFQMLQERSNFSNSSLIIITESVSNSIVWASKSAKSQVLFFLVKGILFENKVCLNFSLAINLKKFHYNDLKFCKLQKDDSQVPNKNNAPYFIQDNNLEKIIFEKVNSYPEKQILELIISEIEKIVIIQSLKKFKGNQVQTSEFLGITRNTIRAKIEKLQIQEY